MITKNRLSSLIRFHMRSLSRVPAAPVVFGVTNALDLIARDEDAGKESLHLNRYHHDGCPDCRKVNNALTGSYSAPSPSISGLSYSLIKHL